MSIVWIVLPNGLQARVLSASIYVAPKLTGTSLAGTDFENWPKTLGKMTFNLGFDPGGSVVAVTPTPQYDPDLWTLVFGSATVAPWAFTDNSARPIWSYSVRDAKAFIDGVYAAVQASPTTYPSVDPRDKSPLGDAMTLVNDANQARLRRGKESYGQARKNPTQATWISAALSEQGAVKGLPAATRAMYLAKRFFDRPASASVKDDKGRLLARPRPALPVFDFHQKLALLADHPYLLRKLGLLLDVRLSVTAFQATPTGFVRFSAINALGAPWADQVSPRTQFELSTSPSFFRAAAASATSPDVRDGFVPVDDTASYFSSQGQPDGDVEKFTGFATNMVRLTGFLSSELTPSAPEPQGIPARRSAGLWVARSGRGDALKARFGAAKALDTALGSATPPDLAAEDLLRGYRIDVKTSTSAWYSLHRRRISYSYGSTPIGDAADEGYLKVASGSSDSSPDGPPDLYVHEIIFGWEGWSLTVPRPGRRLMPVFASDADSVQAPDGKPSPDFPLHTPMTIEPGSLIPLRFGVQYQFRVRPVDLGGNSLPLSAPDTATPHVTALQYYKRFEPILPPTLVPRFAFTEGESVEHLVIRTGEGLSAADYATKLNTDYADPKFPQKVYRATCERHVAAPKTTQGMAETHGDFDGAFATSADTKKFFRVGTREEGTFADKRIPSLTVDNGYIDGNPNQAAIITPPQVPLDQRRPADGGPDVSSLTQGRGDALAPGEYVVCAVTDAQLPYLPDSAAGAAQLFDPASNAALVTIPWGTGGDVWPEWQPVRLQVAEGASVQGSAPSGRLATITLPPATMLTLDLSSLPARNRLGHFAYVMDYGVAAAEAMTGRHWMLTPRRPLLLVHAVPKPLAPPVGTFGLSRGFDDTHIEHAGKLAAHSRSTIQVDMEAAWNDTIDDPTKPLPADGVSSPTLPRTGHAYTVPFVYGTDEVTLRLFYDAHDTRHRFITYTPVAHTRYKEYFPPALTDDLSKITLAGTAPGPLSGGRFNVPSTARPPVPKVVSVVPTFAWDTATGSSVRRGGGLRIYLERPWYESGEGELLGVLLATNADSPVDRVSRWGRDPVVADGVAAALSIANFVSPAATATNLQLDDGRLVNVVAYPVEFNAERKLWFCDVQLDPGQAYFPFVTLSLARYQPDSLKTRELSAPVRAEWAQLTVDRSLVFAIEGATAHVELSGVVSGNAADGLLPQIPMPPARANSGRRVVPPTHRIVAYVQQRSPGSVGEIGWLPLGPETVFAGSREPGGPSATWVADVPIPTAAAGVERRIVVEEREYYAADAAGLYSIKAYIPTDFRVVYLDTIAVP